MPTTTKFTVDETPIDTTVAHVLAVFHGNDPGWLVHEYEPLVGLQRHVSAACRHFKTLEAWWCPDDSYPKLMKALPLRYKFQSSCDECRSGKPCGVWDVHTMKSMHFEPTADVEPEPEQPMDVMATFAAAESFVGAVVGGVKQVVPMLFPNRAGSPQAMSVDEAARYLGVAMPATKETIETAFRAAALRAHPDKGGTAGMMMMAKTAREKLLETVK